MGLRSLIQVLLWMAALVLLVEIMTALGNGSVQIGGAFVGPTPLLGALVAVGVALVAISLSSRGAFNLHARADLGGRPYRFGCSQCGWTTQAATIDEAKALGQQHTNKVHHAQQ